MARQQIRIKLKAYDHRLIDGQTSVTFLVRVKNLLEDPARMMLEV